MCDTLHFVMTGKPGLGRQKGLQLGGGRAQGGTSQVGCEWEGQGKKKRNLSQEAHCESPKLDVDMMGSLIQMLPFQVMTCS